MSLKQFILSPWTALALIGLGDLAMVAGLLPREASFIIGALTALYLFVAPVTAVLFFIIASFPFTPALPVPGFDTFALWRLLVALFALRLLYRNRTKLFARLSFAKIKEAILPHEWFGLLLLFIASVSLLVAQDPVAGLRKLVFFGNAVIVYMILRWMLPRFANVREMVLKGLLVGLGGLLLIGFAQYIVVRFASLYDFWQGWALDVIPVFYGQELARVLVESNTWFSYYAESPPTLRMFSLLPDSHSFGVLMLLGFLLASLTFMIPPRFPKLSFTAKALILGSFALAVYFNGSRGIWLAAAPTALSAAGLMLWWRKKKLSAVQLGRVMLISFVVLALLFPVASTISSRSHGAGIDEADVEQTLAFKRAKSIFDLGETSNRSRLGIWRTSLKSIAERPLLGVGFGNTAVALGENVSAARRGASAHNLYLDIAVETGVLGGLALLAFFAAILFETLWPLIKNNRPPREATGRESYQTALPFILGLAVIWIGIYSLFDIVLLNDRALLTFFTFLALGTSRESQKQSPAADK